MKYLKIVLLLPEKIVVENICSGKELPNLYNIVT
jgi:hypothetical protein